MLLPMLHSMLHSMTMVLMVYGVMAVLLHLAAVAMGVLVFEILFASVDLRAAAVSGREGASVGSRPNAAAMGATMNAAAVFDGHAIAAFLAAFAFDGAYILGFPGFLKHLRITAGNFRKGTPASAVMLFMVLLMMLLMLLMRFFVFVMTGTGHNLISLDEVALSRMGTAPAERRMQRRAISTVPEEPFVPDDAI